MATATAEHSLSDVQRDEILATIDHDSYAVLPFQLPASMLERANAYIDRFRERALADDPDQRFLIETNIVESDPVFRELLTYEPALQLSYDVFGPMFHLGQDTWREKSPHPERGHGSIGWHSDGPVGFPEIDGRCPMHTLRFGYFLTDALHDDSGTLEVIRGSHRRPVLRARTSLRYVRLLENNATDYETDHVTVKAKAGTIVCFHNGIWHQAQAGPNGSAQPRRICYFQYCPTMMHPLHRDVPYPGDMSRFTDEERWLLGEPRSPTSWVVGNEEDWKRMARFRREARDDGFPDGG